MKNFFPLCFLFIFSLGSQAQTIRYVNASATGANNGSSWTDAYTNLFDALDGAGFDDQIWVAAGVYKPAPTPANYWFEVSSGVKLYGGFAGTETQLSQRNVAQNLTVLSGDQAGDDVEGDFTINRSDNARHILFVTDDPQYTTVVDGFRFKGGASLTGTNDPDLQRRGGGIIALTPVVVRNCTFIDNSASSGAGVACLEAGASGSLVEDCLFRGNNATAQSAGVFYRTMTSGEVNRCIFRENTTNRGCVYPASSKTIVVDSCLFEDNTAPGNFGAGFFAWQSSYVLSNSVFRGNKADNAAAIYNDHRDGGNFYTIQNCLFEKNTTDDYGGSGIYNWVSKGEIKNCRFDGNVAPSTASAMYSSGGAEVSVTDCIFENGSANFGGAVANYSDTKMTYERCIFRNNTAGTSGGAMTNGFLANTQVKNCSFESNGARWGGAMFSQNDSTRLNISGTTFSANSAENAGGAVNNSSGIESNIQNCIFNLNIANYGGALQVSEDSLDLAVLNLENCTFTENISNTQAAAFNVSNTDVQMANCLFANNTNVGTGAGGAVSNNASEGKNSEIVAVNCTFVNNVAGLGAGIAQWEDDSSSAILTLQNCILQNLGDNYAIEDGSPLVFTLGGNISNDAALKTYLNAPNDLHDTDAGMADAANGDFHLLLTSPGIDLGTAAGAPPTDLLGKPRINEPDAGCFENQSVVHAPTAGELAMPLRLTPNPAVDFVAGRIAHAGSGRVEVAVFNAGGQVVRQLFFEKNGAQLDFRVGVAELPAGAYSLRARLGEAVFVGRFVKTSE